MQCESEGIDWLHVCTLHLNFSHQRLIFQTSAMRQDAQELEMTDLFRSIKKTENKMAEHIDDTAEAEEAAWEQRKFGLKIFIESNMEDINEKMTEENDSG